MMAGAETIARLEALRAVPGVPAKVASGCETLLQRLQRPVRIGVFGRPGAGKRALLSALSGFEALGSHQDWPTLSLSYAPEARTEAILADGSSLKQPGYPEADSLAQEAIMLRVAGPEAHLQGRSYLLVASDDDPQDVAAGLAWAAPQVDLALWCARSWGRAEQRLWQSAPEALHAHAVLAMTGPPEVGARLCDTFETCFDLRAGGVGPLGAHLAGVIDEARQQERDAAELYLERYRGIAPEADPPAPSPPPEAPAAAPVVEIVRQRPTPLPEAARDDLGRLFQHVRRAAAMLQGALGQGPDDTHEAVLSTFETIFEELTDRAGDMDALNDAWPDLGALLFEARDLALLLRMEGSAEQVVDAARLLLQVRQDMEVKLAA